jgi:hypothetical protein
MLVFTNEGKFVFEKKLLCDFNIYMQLHVNQICFAEFDISVLIFLIKT